MASTWHGLNTLTIVFILGYGDDWNSVPHDLRQAIMMLVAYRYTQCEAASIGPDTGPVSDVPYSVKQILDPYRRWAT